MMYKLRNVRNVTNIWEFGANGSQSADCARDMVSENYAAVLHGPYDIRIEKWPMPIIFDNEILVKVDSVGICGSDVKIYTTGRCNTDVITEPFVIGHEGAGTVVKVGTKVTRFVVGDRVAIEPTQPCRACDYCRRGRYNLCVKPHYCSSAGAPGNLARYYKHVEDFCHKIPENLSMEEGAAVQPLAIAIHACNRAGIKLGSNLVVLGAGPIGVLCAMTARAMGATNILITDVVEGRLDTAKKMGVDHTLLIKKEFTDEETVEKIISLLGTRPDITIDACAFPSAQRTSMMVTGDGGTVMVVGIGADRVEVPLSGALLREVDVRGSFRIANTYPAALAAVSSGVVDLKPFITHQFPLRQTKEALELAKAGKGMKIIIHLRDELTNSV